jgi:hypothetical protein
MEEVMRKPAWAFSVWSDSDWIYAELPAINGNQVHVVRARNNSVGLNKILVLAKARDSQSRLGTKGDPTQHQFEKIDYDPAMVRKVGKPKYDFTPAQRASARDILRKMGMI